MAENIVQQGFNVYDGKQDSFNWKSFAQDGAMGAAIGGIMKGLGKLCFDPDTAVQVPDTKRMQVASSKNVVGVASTTKPIKSMQAGDKVFARDERTGKTVIAKVKQVFKRTSDHLITVEFAAKAGETAPTVQTLKTTRQHPFYVDGKGWLPAGGLAIGNAIVTRAGPRLFVKSIRWERRPQGYTVYNFEVEPLGGRSDSGDKNSGKFTHSYFVGTALGGAWVHNGCPGLDAQFGKKFGQHMSEYPGMDYKKYRNLADSMFDNPALRKYKVPLGESTHAGETHIIDGDNLLRLDEKGMFRSLYPGAKTRWPNGFPD